MTTNTDKNIQKTVVKTVFIAIGMFGFGFALVPLYDVFCEVTGINGKSFKQGEYSAVESKIDTSRKVKIQFIANNNDGMTWEFGPNDQIMRVHPGAPTETTFRAVNTSTAAMIGQAVPSVMPIRAAEYFHKTECFCFNQQTLAGGEIVDMPLRYIVDQDLPKDIHTITLSYTLFDVTPENMAEASTVVAAN